MADNCERVQRLRDKAVVNFKECSRIRKEVWDNKSKPREFMKGDQVWMQKSGINTKLAESWLGPFTVVKRNSALSYKIDTGDRVIDSVHIQLLKEFVSRDNAEVKRVTTVLEPDTESDSIDQQYAEAVVRGKVEMENREEYIRECVQEAEGTMTKEPGLTHYAVLGIDTGSHSPIAQRPYSTSISIREAVDREIDSLLERKIIRESESLWASPMVTVKKPDGSARICIDFKSINAITTPLPFYMPRVEEVLEQVGTSRVISKIDLSKGYHQVPMKEEDICKTAFVSHRGKFEFVRMPFGVRNAPAIFQALMTKLFS